MNVFQAAGSHFKNKPLAGLMIDAGGSNRVLSDAELFARAPSAFAESKHESRTERYSYIPTIQVVSALRAEGFHPVAASQGKSKTPGKADFTKHLIRFRRELDISADSGDAVAEAVLINSHDGTSSYWLLEGAFRAACKNGLIIATGDVKGLKVQHSGKIVDRVIEGSYRIIDNAVKQVEVTKQWQAIELSNREQEIFAKSAAQLRFDARTQHINPADLLSVRREADQGSDLWSVFNRTQEALIRGGNRYTSFNHNEQTGRISSRRLESRPVKSIDRNIGLNVALWTLGEELAKYKLAA